MIGNRFSEIILFCLGLLLFFSCEVKKEKKLFELLPAEKTGINFENRLDWDLEMNILEYLYFYNGGGVAAGDINNDGLVDLYFSGNQVSNRLYLNEGNFKFKDITESAGVGGEDGWSNGVTMADVNGDGLLDIYVCQIGDYKSLKGKNRLYINQGDRTFTELGQEYGVDFKGFGTHAAFFDYDRDGDLDLYLLNHGVKSPEVFTKAENRRLKDEGGDKLFKNLAAEGKRGFVDVTEESGIYSSILGFGLGVSVEDFNEDGWPDLYISNDFTENDYLYLNNQDGTFTESLEQLIANTSRYSMGNDAADINADGLPDIFTTDMLPEDPEIWMKSVGEDKPEVYQIKNQFGYGDQYVRNHLQLNRGKAGFSEISLYSEVFASDWSWSPLIFDMDNDGLVDIHVSNGIVKRPNDLDFIQYSQEADPSLSLEELRNRQIEMLPSVKLTNYTFRNMGELKFSDFSKSWGLEQASYSNGSTYADLDNDGDLDLILNNLNQPAFVYENHSEQGANHFLRINLKAAGLNPFGIGAEVKLFTSNGLFRQRLSTSRGFQSGTSTTLVFGLGELNQIDSIQVKWPDGMKESFPGTSVDQFLGLEQFSGKSTTESQIPVGELSAESETKIKWSHLEKTEVDEGKREYLIPKSFAQSGPAIAVGDVNKDGLDDLYLGGAKDQAGVIFIQLPNGTFEEVLNPIFHQLAKAEDVVAEFADFNGDGNLDLYVGSGGNEEPQGNLFLFDRVFFGDGSGHFQFSPMSLPPIGENTSAVAIQDLNKDGLPDLFLGASVVSGNYGESPKSYLLINKGDGSFRDETESWFGSDIDFGMVNDALWADLNQDGKPELVLTGDWQKIRIFAFDSSNTLKEQQPKGLEKSAGWINSLLVADFNQDGLMDIGSGNLGLNSKLKANEEKPVWLYHFDFDKNEQADPLIFHYMGERLVPFGTRDDLIKQIPGFKRLHNSYQDYSKIKGPEDLIPSDQLAQVNPKAAYEFRSGIYFQKRDGSFEFEAFPWESQLSPIMSMNWDPENQKLVIGGNFNGFRVDLGKSGANALQILTRTPTSWKTNQPTESIPLQTEIRKLKALKTNSGKLYLAASNNGPVWLIKGF
ncbi:VCBS repeat-containing protein [Algoriphagus sp. CAU 1675]|uniref:VCBS repeat-containing protein n=1 Tax=Algoriphagus sp. CAU 1675 TaxID=3032597 RepID=UPI0023DA33AC|nr:VCBS repeat-containing protein [Algoriphagus sp. CAU 1675]MDF2158743.1 VCBS repeat-containing protein [Algoriphagus sp. CAU 1675]